MKVLPTLFLLIVSFHCAEAQTASKQIHGPRQRTEVRPARETSPLTVTLVPGTSSVRISCKNSPATPIIVRISNPAGALIYAESMTTSEEVYHTTINMKAKPHGIYLVEVVAGEMRCTKNIMLD